MDPVSEQRLCQACGFCCDGTLFVRVMIQDGEPIESFRQAGLVVINSAEGQALMPVTDKVEMHEVWKNAMDDLENH